MKEHHSGYRRLIAMAALSFAAMYTLMYAMVDAVGDVYHNLNQFYMAGLMTAPMVVIEVFLMAGMYPKRKLNSLLTLVAIAAGVVFFVLIRQQTGISDRQFLRSMIPHHSSAILMCERASIREPEIAELCKAIVSSQRTEINKMQALLSQQGRVQ